MTDTPRDVPNMSSDAGMMSAPREQHANAAPGRLATSDLTGGPLPMMLPSVADENPQARDSHTECVATIRRLQRLLDNAIRERDDLIVRGFGAVPEQGRHWFVADEHSSYCLACNLPPANSRHAERVA